ncbi:Panacea domain-containing protein [Microbacterium sp. MPKO10]|uniref:Panacea domain-containing protein n=1 Tax=Microbacterium sp. MPKO10 TaxID=2989818 RepID=UPI0022364E1D|nr:type II toxin-antitoxin system antitoxin SocA domain-containing protein [Microbacterium sp. MPKO10]MCW4458204.1 DUF4065 domain-containing protein [Microbacterium sp. MPKO10]
MATAHDVANYILHELGPMSAMKLQKLVYYSQAWHLVWDEEPLFDDEIEAWANGPVVYSLYREHRGMFVVKEWPKGRRKNLTKSEAGSIDAVLSTYGGLTAQQLSTMTHREDPWQNARKGIRDGERSDAEISVGAMHEYYHGLNQR